MKKFQQNLLVILSLALCGLCAFQWYEQTQQRNDITTLNRMVYQKNLTIQSATNSVSQLSHQVEQMDASLTRVKTEAVTNAQLVARQKIQIAQLHFYAAGLTNEISQYKAAVTNLESKLKTVFAGIEKQNSAITNLIAQRDVLVKKYNDAVTDRNNIVVKYNELAKRIRQQQQPSQ